MISIPNIGKWHTKYREKTHPIGYAFGANIYFPTTYRLPFNQHTYTGYLLAYGFQMIYVYVYFLILALVSAYFLSVCFYLEAICDDFGRVFDDISALNAQDAPEIIFRIAKTKLIEATTLQIAAIEWIHISFLLNIVCLDLDHYKLRIFVLSFVKNLQAIGWSGERNDLFSWYIHNLLQ